GFNRFGHPWLVRPANPTGCRTCPFSAPSLSERPAAAEPRRLLPSGAPSISRFSRATPPPWIRTRTLPFWHLAPAAFLRTERSPHTLWISPSYRFLLAAASISG